ncbi:MAG: hypothetical protein WDW36_001694 [Sanguina aurantia]
MESGVVPRRHTAVNSTAEVHGLVNGRPLSPSQRDAVQAMYHAQRRPLVYPAVYANDPNSRSTSARSSFDGTQSARTDRDIGRNTGGLYPNVSLSHWEVGSLENVSHPAVLSDTPGASRTYQPAAAVHVGVGAPAGEPPLPPTPGKLPTWPSYLRSMQWMLAIVEASLVSASPGWQSLQPFRFLLALSVVTLGAILVLAVLDWRHHKHPGLKLPHRATVISFAICAASIASLASGIAVWLSPACHSRRLTSPLAACTREVRRCMLDRVLIRPSPLARGGDGPQGEAQGQQPAPLSGLLSVMIESRWLGYALILLRLLQFALCTIALISWAGVGGYQLLTAYLAAVVLCAIGMLLSFFLLCWQLSRLNLYRHARLPHTDQAGGVRAPAPPAVKHRPLTRLYVLASVATDMLLPLALFATASAAAGVSTLPCMALSGSALEGTGVTFQYLASLSFMLSAVIMCVFASELMEHGASVTGNPVQAARQEVELGAAHPTDQLPQGNPFQAYEPRPPQSDVTFGLGPFGRHQGGV